MSSQLETDAPAGCVRTRSLGDAAVTDLAEACASLAASKDPSELFTQLDRAQGALFPTCRSRLWQRAVPGAFEPDPPPGLPRSPWEADRGLTRDQKPGADWQFRLQTEDLVLVAGTLSQAVAPRDGPTHDDAGASTVALAIRDGPDLAGALLLEIPSVEPHADPAVAIGRMLAQAASCTLERLSAARREREAHEALAALSHERSLERRWLEAAFEAAHGVAREGDLGRTLDIIVRNAQLHLQVDRCRLYRYLGDERAAQLLAAAEGDGELDHSMRIESLDRLPSPLVAAFEQCSVHGEAGDRQNSHAALRSHGVDCRIVAVPIIARGEVIGAVTADNRPSGRVLPATLRHPLTLLAELAAIALAQARKQRELVQAEAQKKQFYREILCAVTNGKLTLCDRDEIEQYWSWPCVGRPVRHEEDVREVREVVGRAGVDAGLPGHRIDDLRLCASEAATNALKHAGGGQAFVIATPTAVRVRVEDQGGGIDQLHLPRATLMKGYSTRASMGLGFTLMHELADRLYLSTDRDGTTLVLEIRLDPANQIDEMLARLNRND